MSLVNDLKTTWKKGKDVALNAPMIERKVKDATSNEKWGPTGTQMQEISRASYNFQDFPIIMGVIWKRINDPGKYWRHVYKSLLLIDYLIRDGSEQVIRDVRHNLIKIQTLTEFQHIEEDKDVGLSVRERAKQVMELLQDDRRIKAERDKAKTNRDKYKGVGVDGRGSFTVTSATGGGYDSYGGGGSGYDGSYGGSGGGGGSYGGSSYGGGNDSYDSYGSHSGGGGGGSSYDRDSRGTYDRDSRYNDRDTQDSSYGRDRDDNYDHDASYSATPSRTTSDRSTASSNATTERRPRAASGGNSSELSAPAPTSTRRPAAEPPSGDLLGGINDLVSGPSAPAAGNDLSLMGLNLGGAPAPAGNFGNFGSTGGFGGAPVNSGFGNTGGFGAPSNNNFNPNFGNTGGFAAAPQQDLFNPRGGQDNSEFGAFQSGGDFNPFQGGGNDFGPPSELQDPKKDDMWEKNKNLFNLDQLNLADNKAKPTATSPAAKVPMASQPKLPMSKTPMGTSSTSLPTQQPPRPISTTIAPGGFPAPNYNVGPIAPVPGSVGYGYPPAGPMGGFPPAAPMGTPGYGYPAPGYPPTGSMGGMGGIPPMGSMGGYPPAGGAAYTPGQPNYAAGAGLGGPGPRRY